MSDRDLIEIGFTAGNDGVLRAPSVATITLTPVGRFYRIEIAMTGGKIVTHVAKIALKISHDEAACEDPDADMIDDHAMRGCNDDEEPWPE
jgi:hypothetical protein